MNEASSDPAHPQCHDSPHSSRENEASMPGFPDTPDDELPRLARSPDRPNPMQEFARTLAYLTPHMFVTPALVGLNVAYFVFMVIQGMSPLEPQIQILVKWGANFGPLTLHGESWRLLACMFIHIGALHLAFNMWVLWDVGRLVERLFGNVGFALLYLFAGLVGSLASVAWNLLRVSAGASGAIFGVFGALLALLVRQRHTIPTQVLVALRNSGLMFLLYNVGFGLFAANLDQAAHIGGLAGGFAAGLVLSQPLTADGARRRSIGNPAFACGGAVVIGIATIALQGTGSEFQRGVQQFGDGEARVIPLVNDAAKRLQAGQMTNVDFADFLEKKVLPDWSAARQRLQALDKLSAQQQESAQLLLELARNRQE